MCRDARPLARSTHLHFDLFFPAPQPQRHTPSDPIPNRRRTRGRACPRQLSPSIASKGSPGCPPAIAASDAGTTPVTAGSPSPLAEPQRARKRPRNGPGAGARRPDVHTEVALHQRIPMTVPVDIAGRCDHLSEALVGLLRQQFAQR